METLLLVATREVTFCHKHTHCLGGFYVLLALTDGLSILLVSIPFLRTNVTSVSHLSV